MWLYEGHRTHAEGRPQADTGEGTGAVCKPKSEALEETGPGDTAILAFQPSEPGSTTFPLLKSPNRDTFPGNQYAHSTGSSQCGFFKEQKRDL